VSARLIRLSRPGEAARNGTRVAPRHPVCAGGRPLTYSGHGDEAIEQVKDELPDGLG